MGVNCQILFNKPKVGHMPGQPISGVVKYAVEKPLEVRNVVLSLSGTGKCHWTETITNDDRTETKHYDGHENYYNACINVIEKKEGEETVTIPEGSYEFSFEFRLPDNVPPSFKSFTGDISYTLLLNFERPERFKFNKRFTANVPIHGRIESDEVPVVFWLKKELSKLYASRTHLVKVKAEISKSSWVSGEKIPLSLVVTNDTVITIPAIRTELIRDVTYRADCGERKYEQFLFRESTVESTSIPKQSTVNIIQEIPTLPDMYSVMNSKIISVVYKLKVTIRLPVPIINVDTVIPITIGGKIEESYEEGPPSYWEVVCEEEKVKI